MKSAQPLLAALLLLVVACAPSVPVANDPIQQDTLLNLYRSDRLRPLVIEYFTQLTENRAVALAILESCDSLGVPPSLAFALAWNESQFNPEAVHYNPRSVDRGLFQLNSVTFARLGYYTVFNPKKNAHYGLSFYKRLCEQLGSTERVLGYYNAGIGLLTNRPLPRRTQAYIKRILADQADIEQGAIAWMYFSHAAELALR